jgi:acyl-CoA dehydrogenase
MAPVDHLAVPKTRKELLDEYPLLMSSGLSPQWVLDECLSALGVFSEFSRAIAPFVAKLDRSDAHVTSDALNQVLDLACHYRILSLAIPRSLGGSGFSMLALSVGLEQLSQRCAGIANLVAAHGLALALVGATGNARHLRGLADRIVAGEQNGTPFLLATAATEPSAGSDLEDYAAMGHAVFESHADVCSSGFALYGRKIYVSNGSLASAFVVAMPTDRARARETLTAFLVYAGAPNCAVVRVEQKLGQRACPAAELLFDGCVVPHEQRLNEGTIAGRTLDMVLGSSRATVGAFGAGIARGVFATSRYLAKNCMDRDRRPILEDPGAQALLARMWMNAQSARHSYLAAAMAQRRSGLVSLMETEALRALDRLVPSRLTHVPWANKLLGWERIDHEARRVLSHLTSSDIATSCLFGSAAKLTTSELALANCALAQAMLGPTATREDSGIPKYWRDARLLSIYEGTNEICALDVMKHATEARA